MGQFSEPALLREMGISPPLLPACSLVCQPLPGGFHGPRRVPFPLSSQNASESLLLFLLT